MFRQGVVGVETDSMLDVNGIERKVMLMRTVIIVAYVQLAGA